MSKTETELEPEELIYRKVRELNYDSFKINLPKSQEFFRYNDQVLHVRTFWPKQPPKAIVMFIHGYISHINRPVHEHLSSTMLSNGYAYVGFDFPGHGYSTGERALVLPIDELLKMIMHAIELFYAKDTKSYDHFIDRKFEIPRETPLFFIGHSMGGALSLLASLEVKKHPFNFKGVIYLCPALKISPLPFGLRFVLDNLLVPCCPKGVVPKFMDKPHNPRNTWKNDDYLEYVKHDWYPQNPKGLGWGLPVRLQSGSILLQLAEEAQEASHHVDYPFIMFHDPDDKTVDYEGATSMIAKCKTKDHHKVLVELPDSGHDILINRLGIITRKSVEWMKDLLADKEYETISHSDISVETEKN